MKTNFKKRITLIAVLALTLVLCLSSIFIGYSDKTIVKADGVTFSAVDGFSGDNANESYEKALDGKKTQSDFTKWCVGIINEPYIVIKASEAIIVNGYTFTVGNDNADSTKGAGRNPKDWTLEGSNDFSESTKTGTWTNIVTVTGDTSMQDINYEDYSFTVSGNQTAYQYYKFKFTAVRGENATLMQLSEIALSYTLPAEPAPVITALDGTGGHSGEGYENLFDGKYTQSNFSKWCLQGTSAFVIFKVETTKYLVGYSFVTGNDNQSNGGRNPKTWVLYGANDYDETEKTGGTWNEVHSVTDDAVMQDVNYTQYDYDVDTPATYTYYKLEIASNHGADTIQLAEILLTFSDCLHNWQVTTKTSETCTSLSSTKYVCSKCSEEKTVYGSVYAYHDVDDDYKCKNCGETFVKTVGGFIVSGAQENRDYIFSDGELKILTGAKMTIENADKTTSTDNRIYVQPSVSANIVLAGVNISATSGAAFKIADNSTGDVVITLKDGTVNTLQSGNECAGLQKNGFNGTLTINGNTGKLIANGGYRAAGIGSSSNIYGPKFANLTINGGIIIATGGQYGAGIGCGGGNGGSSIDASTYAQAKNITINGGIVIATAGTQWAAGIGGGYSFLGSTFENMVISGGSVKATRGSNAPYDIGQGAIFSDSQTLVPKKALQIVNGDGENVYSLTISNPDGKDVYIDGVKQNYANHSVADETDTNLYLYLTGKDHVIKVGDEETTYHYNDGGFIVCGASNNFKSNDDVHWYACNYSNCTVQHDCAEHVYDREVKSGHVKTAASCTVQGEYYKSCVCGKNGTETFFGPEPTGHNWVEKVNTDYRKEKQNCEHGTIYYKVCSGCGTVSDTLTWEYGEGTGHDFTSTSTYYKKEDATCTDPAVYYRQCTKCYTPSDTITFTYGYPNGHDWETVVDDKYLAAERSCTNRTTYYYSCGSCGLSGKGISYEDGGPYRETFEDTSESYPSHNYEWQENEEKTYHYKECTVCGDIPESSEGAHWYLPSCGVECYVCGILREDKDENHNFYKYSEDHDDTHHWYVCHNAECDKVIYKAEHTFNDGIYVFSSSDGTYTHALKCDTCRYTKPVENCTLEMQWSENLHKQVCTVCGQSSSSDYHSYDNACDTTCNEEGCGYERTITHNYNEALSKNDTQHWYECKICGDKKDLADHEFTQKHDELYHWSGCSCGYIKDKVEHIYDDDEDLGCNDCEYVRPYTLKSLKFVVDGYAINSYIPNLTVKLADGYEGIDFSDAKYDYDWFIVTDMQKYNNSYYNYRSLDFFEGVVANGDSGYFIPQKEYYLILFCSIDQTKYDFSVITANTVSLDGVGKASYCYVYTDLMQVAFKLNPLSGVVTVDPVSSLKYTLSGYEIDAPTYDINFISASQNEGVQDSEVLYVYKDGVCCEDDSSYTEDGVYTVCLMLNASNGYTFYGFTPTDIEVNGVKVLSAYISAGGGRVALVLQLPSLKGEHDHVEGESYRYDETGHYKTCEVCSVNLATEPHVYDDDNDLDCNVCGYKRKLYVDYAKFGLSGYEVNSSVIDIKISLDKDSVGIYWEEDFEYGRYDNYCIITDVVDYVWGYNGGYVDSDERNACFLPETKYYLYLKFYNDNYNGYSATKLTADKVFLEGCGNPVSFSVSDGGDWQTVYCIFELPLLEGENLSENAGKQIVEISGYELDKYVNDVTASLGEGTVGSSSIELTVFTNNYWTSLKKYTFNTTDNFTFSITLYAEKGYNYFNITEEDIILPDYLEIFYSYLSESGSKIEISAKAKSLATEHEHVYETDYSSDYSGHWHKCEICGRTEDFCEHLYDSFGDIVCNRCGYVGEKVVDKIQLTLSGYEYGNTLGAVSVTPYGDTEYIFASSGYVCFTEDDSSIFGDYSFTDCDYTKTFSDCTEYYMVVKIYQLTEGGYYFYSDSVELVGYGKAIATYCDWDYTYLEALFKLPALYAPHEHTYGEWTVLKEATCTEKGEKKHLCTYCGEEEIEEIPLKEHNYVSVVTKPTCTEKGYTTHTCDCGRSYVDSYVNESGHNPLTAVIENERGATCKEEGSCEEVVYCSTCGEEISRTKKTIEKTEHSYGEWMQTKAPTCTEEGEKTRTCSCGSKETSTIEKIAHTASDFIVDKEATCTEKGSKHKECTVCGEIIVTESISAIGHTYGGWIRDKEPTTTVQGHEYRECSVCYDKEERDVATVASVACFGGLNASSCTVFLSSLVLTAIGYAVYKKRKK